MWAETSATFRYTPDRPPALSNPARLKILILSHSGMTCTYAYETSTKTRREVVRKVAPFDHPAPLNTMCCCAPAAFIGPPFAPRSIIICSIV